MLSVAVEGGGAPLLILKELFGLRWCKGAVNARMVELQWWGESQGDTAAG